MKCAFAPLISVTTFVAVSKRLSRGVGSAPWLSRLVPSTQAPAGVFGGAVLTGVAVAPGLAVAEGLGDGPPPTGALEPPPLHAANAQAPAAARKPMVNRFIA